jgi:hypothetical protein
MNIEKVGIVGAVIAAEWSEQQHKGRMVMVAKMTLSPTVFSFSHFDWITDDIHRYLVLTKSNRTTLPSFGHDCLIPICGES